MNIEMRGISKAFGENRVLTGVDFTVRSGEVHALMGENGAGKSTLMNILTGLHRADGGTIVIDGEERVFASPREAERHGVAFIHQELNIWPNLTILENLFLMNPPKTAFGTLDFAAMRTRAEAACAELGITLPLDTIAEECSVGQQQMTEILRVLMLHAQIVIMDEPTAALTERETEVLFGVMSRMKDAGVGIVYISHRMEEVFAVSDQVTVMRDGVAVRTCPTGETDMARVVRDMVGRSLTEYYPARTRTPGEVIFAIHNMHSRDVFTDVSFTLREGEILGVAGLMGAGRTEIMRALFGVDRKDGAQIQLHGEEITIATPRDAIRAGIGFITENRKTEGLILDFSIGGNISLPCIDRFAAHHIVKAKDEDAFISSLAEYLAEAAFTRTIDMRADLLWESNLDNTADSLARLRRLKAAGYRVELHVRACSRDDAWLHLQYLYQQQLLKAAVLARILPYENYHAACDRFLETVTVLKDEPLDRLIVRSRKGLVYDSDDSPTEDVIALIRERLGTRK